MPRLVGDTSLPELAAKLEENPMIYDGTTQPGMVTCGITAMGIVSAASGVSSYLGATYSVDGGMWPFVLFLYLLFNLAYSVVFAAIVGLIGPIRLSHAVVLNLLLGTVLIAHSALFYLLDVDWLAVNNGVKKLTAIQAIIYNDATYLLIYIAALIAASAVAYQGRKDLQSTR
jgi:hypothetical protein